MTDDDDPPARRRGLLAPADWSYNLAVLIDARPELAGVGLSDLELWRTA